MRFFTGGIFKEMGTADGQGHVVNKSHNDIKKLIGISKLFKRKYFYVYF